VSISHYNVDYLARRFGVPADRVQVIRCGVDLKEFAPCGEAEAVPPMLLSVGRLHAMKGFDTLLDACALLKGRREFRCTIVGAGAELEPLRRQVAALALEREVEILTAVPHAALIDLYRRCRLYVQPCRRDRDGMQDGIPATIMEAMAVGKPVVSTHVSGIPELVADGREGLLVPPDAPAALAQAIEGLLTDPARCRAMGSAAARKVRAEFDATANAGILAGHLLRLVGGGRSGGDGAP